MTKLAAALILSLASIGAAHALTTLPAPRPPGPVAVPEIDPAGMVSALTLLAGGLAVIRGRRGNDHNKKK